MGFYTSELTNNLLEKNQVRLLTKQFVDISDVFRKRYPNILPNHVVLNVYMEDNGRELIFKVMSKNINGQNILSQVKINPVSSFCGGIFLHSLSWTEKALNKLLLHCVYRWAWAEGYSCLTYISTANQSGVNDALSATGFTQSFEQKSRRTNATIYQWNHDLIDFYDKVKYSKDFWKNHRLLAEQDDKENF